MFSVPHLRGAPPPPGTKAGGDCRHSEPHRAQDVPSITGKQSWISKTLWIPACPSDFLSQVQPDRVFVSMLGYSKQNYSKSLAIREHGNFPLLKLFTGNKGDSISNKLNSLTGSFAELPWSCSFFHSFPRQHTTGGSWSLSSICLSACRLLVQQRGNLNIHLWASSDMTVISSSIFRCLLNYQIRMSRLWQKFTEVKEMKFRHICRNVMVMKLIHRFHVIIHKMIVVTVK